MIIRLSPCDSMSYVEFVCFHFHIINCILVSKVLDKNPKMLCANILLLYTGRTYEKAREICGEFSVKFGMFSKSPCEILGFPCELRWSLSIAYLDFVEPACFPV